MEDFKKRLFDEYHELKERKEKLEAFIERNPKFNDLDTVMKNLMSKQLEYMGGYLECLRQRVGILVGWDYINGCGVEQTAEEDLQYGWD